MIKNKGGISIVIVDDEPDILQVFTSALTCVGYTVKGFSEPEYEKMFPSAKIDGIITKPVTIAQLIEAIERQLT